MSLLSEGYPFIHQELECFAATGKVFLEIGCGVGQYKKTIVSKGAQYIGVDVTDKDYGAQKRNVDIVADAANLSAIEDASIDVVFMVAVFYLLPAQDISLREFFRILKPGGSVLFFDYTEKTINRMIPNHYEMLLRDRSHYQLYANINVNNFIGVYRKLRFAGFRKINLLVNKNMYRPSLARVIFFLAYRVLPITWFAKLNDRYGLWSVISASKF
ncbi:MAG: class I SAM-dependent methyltransferase [Oligoflexia bacterium]|nr:class I SAM-dependent methyltransferase [Oligoflexia bacterium]